MCGGGGVGRMYKMVHRERASFQDGGGSNMRSLPPHKFFRILLPVIAVILDAVGTSGFFRNAIP